MTCSKALKKLTCAFSALMLCAAALGSDLTEFRDAIQAAKSERQLDEAILAAPDSLYDETFLQEFFDRSVEQLEYIGQWQDVKAKILSAIEARIAYDQTQPGQLSDPGAVAKHILDNPIYAGRDERKGRNWLDNSASRIGDRIMRWLNGLFPDRQPSFGGSLPGASLTGLTAVAWFLIGAVILLTAFFVFKNFKVAGRRRRRVGGILEDDEPERTADQWLLQAEKLEAEGKYREAVRCLYIACLVRYDDGRVARFRRHETNWEHLHRIEGSSLNPGLDFRTPTQRFDKVWYGFQVRGTSDVQDFREVYQRLCELLQLKNAA